MDDCDIDSVGDVSCGNFCNDVQEFTADRSSECQDAYTTLFECASVATCEELEFLASTGDRDVFVGIIAGRLVGCDSQALALIACIPGVE